jgi:hypothetical protein
MQHMKKMMQHSDFSFSSKSFLRFIIYMSIAFQFAACEESDDKPNSVEFISDKSNQDSLFKDLINLMQNTIPDNQLHDSLAFLILPLELSCPSCRDKTIDSIVKHQNNLAEGHYIILSASEGIKNIRSYFVKRDKEMPVIKNQLIIDSVHVAYKHKLIKENPAVFYSKDKKVYKKVVTIPATIRDDLREFFSGVRLVTADKTK